MIKLVTALAATCACALAAPAAAGAFSVGAGAMPGLAVDAAGTAYIAWSGPGSPASLQFCRLPRGATACDIRHAIVAPGETTSRAFVAVSGTRVVVVQYRYGAVSKEYASTSTNGGASFGAGRSVGTLPFFDAVVGPGDTLSGVTDAQPAEIEPRRRSSTNSLSRRGSSASTMPMENAIQVEAPPEAYGEHHAPRARDRGGGLLGYSTKQ